MLNAKFKVKDTDFCDCTLRLRSVVVTSLSKLLSCFPSFAIKVYNILGNEMALRPLFLQDICYLDTSHNLCYLFKALDI